MAELHEEQSLSEAADVPTIDTNEATLKLDDWDRVNAQNGVGKESFNATNEAYNKLVEDLSDVDEDEFDKLVYKKTKIRLLQSHSAPPSANGQNNSRYNLNLSGKNNTKNPAAVSAPVENETVNAASVAGTTESNELATRFVENQNVITSPNSDNVPSEPIADTNVIELVCASSDLGRAVLEATALPESVAVSNQPSPIRKALTRPLLLGNSIEMPTPMKQFLMKPRAKSPMAKSHKCESVSNETPLEPRNSGKSNVSFAVLYLYLIIGNCWNFQWLDRTLDRKLLI